MGSIAELVWGLPGGQRVARFREIFLEHIYAMNLILGVSIQKYGCRRLYVLVSLAAFSSLSKNALFDVVTSSIQLVNHCRAAMVDRALYSPTHVFLVSITLSIRQWTIGSNRPSIQVQSLDHSRDKMDKSSELRVVFAIVQTHLTSPVSYRGFVCDTLRV